MKKHNPKTIATKLREIIKLLSRTAAKHERGSERMRVAGEKAGAAFVKLGLPTRAAVDLVATICEGQSRCEHCGKRGREMSGANCLSCAIKLRNRAVAEALS